MDPFDLRCGSVEELPLVRAVSGIFHKSESENEAEGFEDGFV